MSSLALSGTSVATVKVLLVEDDPADASIIGSILRSAAGVSYATEAVTTLAEARRRLEEARYDLVLLDLCLPDTTGLDSFLALQHLVAEVPIVLLTGMHDESVAAAALQQGAEDYLVKGQSDRATILRSLRYAIERHRNVRELIHVTSELQRANESLEQLTLIDPLTELMNRRGLQRAISRELENLNREERDVIVLLIDIDDFKRVNDSFGLAVGDVVLMEIAARLRGCVRGGDYVGRIGGDEFLMILPDSNRAEVTRIAERTRAAIASTQVHHGAGAIGLTASIAAILLTADTPALDEVLSRAHALLHESKLSGKNRITYQPEEFEDTDRRRSRHGEMCSKLTQGKNLRTVRQPIMNLLDESPVAWEFLSRYSNGVTERPEHFFRICAERNVLTLVDHQCLRSAVHAAGKLPPSRRFHVNLFPSTLLSVPADHLLSVFPTPLPPSTYCVEISEQQIIGDPSYLVEPVRLLREAGVLIAIDDVGFGNSCLESLVLLEPDVIKIDKSLCIGLTDGDHRIRQLRAYLALGQTLGAEVIVEGIETAGELAIMRELGVQYGQGFFWGRPA